MKALYRFKDKVITDEDIKCKLNEAGVCNGDTILLHTSLLGFGRPLVAKDELLDAVCQCFLNVVGKDGTVLMPTFTYSFCNNEIYDVQKSPSKMGALNEHFRLNYAIRTLHPIFSFAIFGAKSEYLLDSDNTSCFGEDSIFARLYEINARLVFFGTSTARNTFIHFVERSFGVSYRYEKKFEGVVIDGRHEIKTHCDYYVRNLEGKSLCDYTRIEPFLSDFKSINLANTKILSTTTKSVYNVGLEILRDNEKFFLLD